MRIYDGGLLMATTCKLIAKNVLGSDTSSVTFGSIPATFDDLVLICSGRTDRSGSVVDYLQLRFNSDTGNNYSFRVLLGDGASATSSAQATFDGLSGLRTTGASAIADTFGSGEAYIPNYSGSQNKSVSITGVSETNGSTAYIQATAGLWSSASAITSIELSPYFGTNVKSGSSFYLYGITKA